MRPIQLLAVSAWTSFGVAIVCISIWQGQQAAVWGSASKDNSATIAAQLKTEPIHDHSQLLQKLPPTGLLPDNPLYLVKAGHDLAWQMTSGTAEDQAKRLIHLANQRLAAALTLCEKGEYLDAIETVTKAEHYLEEANLLIRESGLETELLPILKTSANLHQQGLLLLEACLPEQLKPLISSIVYIPQTKL